MLACSTRQLATMFLMMLLCSFGGLGDTAFTATPSQFDYGRCNTFFGRRLWHLAAPCYAEGLSKAPEQNPAMYLNLIGVSYHEMHRYMEAKDHYQKAVTLNPGTAIYHFNLAMVIAQQEGIVPSLSSFAEAMKLDPKQPKFPFYLAKLYFQERKFKRAEALFRKGLEIDSNNPEMWNTLGVVCFEQGQYRKAASAYRIAVALHRSNYIYNWNLGNALYNFRHANKEIMEEAAANIMIAWEADSRNADYTLTLGNVFFNLQQYENATRFYDLGMKLQRAEDPVYRNLRAVAAVNDYHQKVSVKDHHFISIDPNSGRYVLTRDPAYFTDLNQLETIQKSYEAAAKLKGDKAVYYYNLGNLAFGQDDFLKALKYFDEALHHDPENPEYHSSKGLCLMELEEDKKAVESFEAAIRLDPDNVMHHFNKGRSLFKLERFLEAAQAFEAAARLEPDNANVQNWWGTALVHNGYDELAAPMFNKAAALDQHQHTYHVFFDGMLHSLGADFRPPPNYSSPTL
eukprot:GGOE01018333.1.p1 GENE.GGOE01018333.1~~GGOE01018333.1.p1  ORF type:complete len:513 (-),score=128.30 GGOE01018333.1:179-1717(-)